LFPALGSYQQQAGKKYQQGNAGGNAIHLPRINQELHSNVTHIANVRELENVLMKGVALSHGDTFTRELLPDYIRNQAGQAPAIEDKPLTDRSLEEVEREHVKRILEATGWHRGKACEILGVSRPRLRRMINQYDLVPPQGVVVEDSGE